MNTEIPSRNPNRPARRRASRWPNVYKRLHRSGQIGFVVDLGTIDGKRQRHTFETKAQADTFAEMARIKKQNEGASAFGISEKVRVDATRATQLLAPHDVTLVEAAHYYLDHVVAFQNAPTLQETVTKLIEEATRNDRRQRTIGDLRYRLETFAADFPERKLGDLTVEDIKDWLDEEDWSPRTRINFLTKISQLYNYSVKHGWVDTNLAEKIDRPSVEDKEPGILTIEQARNLLEVSSKFDLLPYVAIGLFAGLRSAELLRLDTNAVMLVDRVIVVGQSVAKKRSRRVVEIGDVLSLWLQNGLKPSGPIVSKGKLSERLAQLKAAAGIEQWPHNALRHSFGSYHLAFHGDATKTAYQMGHKSTDVIHNHYKALVLKSEAEKFWALRPVEPEPATSKLPVRKLSLD